MTEQRGWVGCYTSRSGGSAQGGIGRLRAGAAGIEVSLAARAVDPSYLALSGDSRFLYAVGETDDGSVSAYAVEGDALRPLGTQPTGGSHPCHVATHPSGRHVLTASYGSGSVAVHPVAADGSLLAASDVVRHEGSGADAERQDGPHAHMVTFDPAGRHVFVADLGIDAVVTYDLDATAGTLAERYRLDLPPGTGPRHLAFSPSGHAAYIVGELDSTVTACRHANGVLTPVAAVPTRHGPDGPGVDQQRPDHQRPDQQRPDQQRPDQQPNLPAAVVVAADGKCLYVTNRGDDTVARIGLSAGGLLPRLVASAPAGGQGPRDLARDVTGTRLFAANEVSGSVVELAVDGRGDLTRVRSTGYPAATCVVLDRSP